MSKRLVSVHKKVQAFPADRKDGLTRAWTRIRQVGSMKKTNAKTVAVFGLPIANVTMTEAVECIERCIASGRVNQIATANLDFARNARKDGFLHQIICDCEMVLPDGAPMLWAARLFGSPLKQRVTGVDLIPELARLSAERGFGIFLLGATDQNAEIAAQVLEKKHPGVRIVGRFSPDEASLRDMDDGAILERLREAKPDILLVAFGNPKQEIWIHRNRARLDVPVAIGIGGSLDMIAGKVRRAPKFVQWMQMEWMFRMLQEPRRLLPRYARDLVALLRHLPIELVANWRQEGEVGGWPMEAAQEGDAYILRMPEIVTGEVCASVILQTNLAMLKSKWLVVDMSTTARVEADGLGCLLEARRMAMTSGLSFWLTAVSPSVRRVLEASSLLGMFRMAMTPGEAVRLAQLGAPEGGDRGQLLHMVVDTSKHVKAQAAAKKRASA
jgi:N-acetylglucosaminyldiphosphoundecaprenol N-acetyl-beta-D-mannosaminyltransferase